MSPRTCAATAALAAFAVLGCQGPRGVLATDRLTAAEVLKASAVSDWRPLDAENTLYLELASGRIVMELAPAFAPEHAANIKALVREKYFDGLAILRSQDNYVVQWGDPEEDGNKRRKFKTARTELAPEFSVPIPSLPFTRLPDGDVYAPEVGHSNGFPAARDPESGTAWLAHCYGALGVGRGDNPDNGSGAELYVVIGHAPRHLDRNVIVVGRVVHGMELLSTLPRGSGPLGFYEKARQRVPIKSVRMAADVPESQRSELEVLRTDTATFAAFVDARRHRREGWFRDSVGRIELCNVPLPVRTRAATR